MRTKTLAAIIGLALLGFGGTASAAAFNFVGVPGAPILPGTTFTVTIQLDLQGSQSTGEQFRVVFDTNVLTGISGANLGVPPYQLNITGGNPTVFSPGVWGFEAAAFAPINDPGGAFDVGQIQFSAAGPGSFNLATVFGPGEGVLDGTGNVIPGVTQASGLITVVPEPGTLALLGLGLGALAFAGRRR